MPSTLQQEIARIIKATLFAAEKHKCQRRKGADASPYINHPIALANLLINEAQITDTDVLCAALLHDTIEDTQTTEQELRSAFGEVITRIVLEVTDDKSLPKTERKRRQVEHAPQLSPKARLVKLSDKICNLRDIVSSAPTDWSLDRKREYFDWARSVVDQIRGTHARLEAIFDAAYSMKP